MAKYNYYISSGELNRMYTLRVSYLDFVQTSDGVITIPRDFYCCNLSTDKDKAYGKAVAYVQSKQLKEECGLVDSDKVPTLDEIYRRNQEELESARKLAEETAKLALEEFEERCYQMSLGKIEKIRAGIWPFGKYRGTCIGHEFGNKDPDYQYIVFMGSIELIEKDNRDKQHNMVMRELQKALHNKFDWLFNLPEANGKFYGNVKSREDFSLTPIFETSYPSNFGYNQYIYVQKFIKDTGELVVYKGSSPIECDLGQTVIVKATIKNHDEYKGEKQTFISRPKLISTGSINA